MNMLAHDKIFILTDARRITPRMNSLHLDIRTVKLHDRPTEYLVASSEEVLLKAVKPQHDPYNIIKVNKVFLEEYCKNQKLGCLLITSCYCDLDTKRPIVKYHLVDKAS